MFKAPYYPIVYVRGYAGTQTEVEDTVATPYMGFNLGSTKVRQSWDDKVSKYIFESPLIRLLKDHEYEDVYRNGGITSDEPVQPKSIWIYRYYDEVSEDLGTGERPEIEEYAEGLDRFIETIRDRICGNDIAMRDQFKVHIVAHSMGGLVTRCYLQNIYPGKHDSPPPVDKVFTYATPHGGIDLRLIGNIPAFLQFNNIENFNNARMREYLKLDDGDPIDSLGGNFDASRFFSLVGSNYRDYPAAKGLASAAVGPMSDGLVQIRNATVYASPRAFVHRSHSGPYGIVNSEEGYQNLRRFLFGDIRIDITLEIEDVPLPTQLQKEKDKGRDVRASYHAETVVRVRGTRYDMHRRTVAEASAHFIPWDRIEQRRPIYLYTGYLLKDERVNRRGPLGFSIDLGVLVPEYVVDRAWRRDQHFDGGYIFRDKINFDLSEKEGKAILKYGLDSKTPNRATRKLGGTTDGAVTSFRIPIEKSSRPGIKAILIIAAQPWQ
jgi:hypothetical protein